MPKAKARRATSRPTSPSPTIRIAYETGRARPDRPAGLFKRAAFHQPVECANAFGERQHQREALLSHGDVDAAGQDRNVDAAFRAGFVVDVRGDSAEFVHDPEAFCTVERCAVDREAFDDDAVSLRNPGGEIGLARSPRHARRPEPGDAGAQLGAPTREIGHVVGEEIRDRLLMRGRRRRIENDGNNLEEMILFDEDRRSCVRCRRHVPARRGVTTCPILSTALRQP
jgi:hypothetical protein